MTKRPFRNDLAAVFRKPLIYNKMRKSGVTIANTRYPEVIETQRFAFHAKNSAA